MLRWFFQGPRLALDSSWVIAWHPAAKIGEVILSAWKEMFVGGVMGTRVGKGVGLLLGRAMSAKIIGVDLVLWSVRPTAGF